MVTRMDNRVWKDLHPKVKRGVYADMANMTVVDGKATNGSGKDITDRITIAPGTTEKQVRALKGVDALSEHEIANGGFVFAFFKQSRTMVERFPSLTPQDTARLMFIGTYVAWQTGRLQSDNGKKIIDREELEKMVEMSRKRFNELFKRYEEEGILREDKESGEIFVNPSVFYRGSIKEIGFDVSHYQHTRMFKTTVRDLYAQFKGRKLGQLAIIYSVIPYLNFSTNIVCYNPEETAVNLLRTMSLDKLAVLLGYDDAYKLKRAMNGIKVNGFPVFAFHENPNDRRKLKISVSPNVVFGGDSEALKAIQLLHS